VEDYRRDILKISGFQFYSNNKEHAYVYGNSVHSEPYMAKGVGHVGSYSGSSDYANGTL